MDVEVQSANFFLTTSDEGFPSVKGGRRVGDLIDVLHQTIRVRTGIELGTVELVIERLESPPGDALNLTSRAWEAVVEVSVDIGESPLQVRGGWGGPGASAAEVTQRTGWHRLRFYAFGRDVDQDTANLDSEEVYRIQAWKTDSHAPDAVLLPST